MDRQNHDSGRSRPDADNRHTGGESIGHEDSGNTHAEEGTRDTALARAQGKGMDRGRDKDKDKAAQTVQVQEVQEAQEVQTSSAPVVAMAGAAGAEAAEGQEDQASQEKGRGDQRLQEMHLDRGQGQELGDHASQRVWR